MKYHEDARRAFELANKTVSNEDTPYIPLPERFPGVDPALFKLVSRMLRLDRKVPSTRELLQDPYFDDMDRSIIKDGPSKSHVKTVLKVRVRKRWHPLYLLLQLWLRNRILSRAHGHC